MKFRLSIDPVLALSTCLLISFAAFNFYLRSGFHNSYATEVFVLSGLSLFFLLTPSFLTRTLIKSNDTSWIRNPSLLSVLLVFVVCCCGYLSPHYLVSFLVSSFGFLLLLLRLFEFRKSQSSLSLVNLVLIVFFSIWIVSVIWGGYHVRPTFIETLVVSKPYFFDQEFYNADTLFNLCIAQMLKHHQAPSLGMDGLPIMYYHYGGHWIMAQLSRFTGLHLVHIYNFGYPIIFIPLFFKIFIQFSLQVQEVLFKKTESGFLFMLVLMCLFIQVPSHLYAGGLLGISGLVNDSFTISLTLIFVFLHTGLLFWKTGQNKKWMFILVVVLLIGASGIIKISSGFVLSCLAGYLFLRLQLYRQVSYWVGAIGILVVFLITYWLTSESIPFGIRKVGGDEGLTGLFHFYKQTHTFEPISWFIGFYFWLYLVILFVLFLIPSPAVKKLGYLWRNKLTLPAEISLVVALVGVVPSLVLVFNGGNSMYFSGVQLFIAGSFVLAFTPILSENIQRALGHMNRLVRWTLTTTICIGLILLMYKEVRWDFNKMIKINVQTRREILGIPVDPEWRVKYDRSTFGIFDQPVAQAYDTIKFGKFIAELMKQEETVSSKKLLFINHQTLSLFFFRNIKCIETSFIAPAFSGYAMLDGLSYQCNIGMYGEGYYERNFTGIINPTDDQLCKNANEKGFNEVVKLDPINNHFSLVQCTEK